MSRNGGVRDALTRLKLKHNAMMERRKKDRESFNKAKNNHQAPACKNSLAELDSHLSSPPRTSSTSLHNSSNTKMPSVAEWLLFGDDDNAKERAASSSAAAADSTAAAAADSTATDSTATAAAADSTAASNSTPNSPQRSTKSNNNNNIAPISESHSFDHSQFSSHFYSEMTDDYTVEYDDDDYSMEDVTLASSKEPGLLAHGFMAVGELFGHTSPMTPSPERRRRQRTRRVRSDCPRARRRLWMEDRSLMELSDDEEEEDDSTTITFSKNDSPSVTTATTASSSPSNLLGEANNMEQWGARLAVNVNIIDSSSFEEVEMSLETVTRIEI